MDKTNDHMEYYPEIAISDCTNHNANTVHLNLAESAAAMLDSLSDELNSFSEQHAQASLQLTMWGFTSSRAEASFQAQSVRFPFTLHH